VFVLARITSLFACLLGSDVPNVDFYKSLRNAPRLLGRPFVIFQTVVLSSLVFFSPEMVNIFVIKKMNRTKRNIFFKNFSTLS